MRKRRAVPVLVAAAVAPFDELALRAALASFTGGWAQAVHFDALSRCADLLGIGAAASDADEPLRAATGGALALLAVRERWGRTRRLGVSGDELRALSGLVAGAGGFWPAQPPEAYYQAMVARRRAGVA